MILFATFAISFGLSMLGCTLMSMYVLFMIDAYGIYIKKSKDSFVLLEEIFFK